MTIDIGSNITGLIQKLATQMGVAVEKVFPIYVKQSLIEGYTDLSIILIGNLIVICAIIFLSLKRQKMNENEANSGDMFLRFACVVIFLLNAIFSAGYPTIISQILNPEYHAFQKITKDISRIK